MTISYPLTLPTNPSPRVMTISAMFSVAVTESIFSFKSQTYQYTGEKWGLEIQYPPLTADQMRSIQAFLLCLKGGVGTFSAGDLLMTSPKGIATGTPLVNGGSQTGNSLSTSGWTAGQTGIMKAGDYFQIGSYLYMVLVDANSNGSGIATLDIFPRLRSSPANGAPLIISSPKGLWKLSNKIVGWSADQEKMYGVSFQAVEAI